MARKGPVTVDTSTLAVGLGQIRVGDSATNIAFTTPQLTSADSIGSLTKCDFKQEVKYLEHFSGFPKFKDFIIPLEASATIEVEAEEISPANLALALGKSFSVYDGFTSTHSGEIGLGNLAAPSTVRIELMYDMPDDTHHVAVVLPRAQVSSSLELSLKPEEIAKVPMTISAQPADSSVAGGNAVWDNKPMGAIQFT